MAQDDRRTETHDGGRGAEEERFHRGPGRGQPGEGWAYGDDERAYAAGYGIDEGPYGGRWGRGPGEGGYGGHDYSGRDEPRGPHEDRTWVDRERSHRGRGPKGYVRADARIAEDINEALTEDPYVDASEVMVAVSAGEVTLSGHTATQDERRRAEVLASAVLGAREVRNGIRVEPGQEEKPPPRLPIA